jgi:hypothetical protein
MNKIDVFKNYIEVNNVWVINGNLMFDEEGNLIWLRDYAQLYFSLRVRSKFFNIKISITKDSINYFKPQIDFYYKQCKNVGTLDKTILQLPYNGVNNFGHFFDYVGALANYNNIHDNIIVLVSTMKKGMTLERLKFFIDNIIGTKRQYFHLNDFQKIFCKKAILYFDNEFIKGRWNKELIEKIRNRLYDGYCKNITPSDKTKLFVSRRNQRREFKNQIEFENILLKNNFNIITGGEDLNTVISAFMGAEFICAQHSSCLKNIIFCRKENVKLLTINSGLYDYVLHCNFISLFPDAKIMDLVMEDFNIPLIKQTLSQSYKIELVV